MRPVLGKVRVVEDMLTLRGLVAVHATEGAAHAVGHRERLGDLEVREHLVEVTKSVREGELLEERAEVDFGRVLLGRRARTEGTLRVQVVIVVGIVGRVVVIERRAARDRGRAARDRELAGLTGDLVITCLATFNVRPR